MTFASDGVRPIGGVGAVGLGTPPMSIAPGPTQAAGVPLVNQGIDTEGNFRPQLQIPVIKSAFQKAGEKAPGLSSMFGNAFLHVAKWVGGIAEPTRKNNTPTELECATFLTGSPGPQPDPEGRGLLIERAPDWGLDFGEGGNFDSTVAKREGIDPILNNKDGEDVPNQSTNMQNWDTNSHAQLTTYRASFPNIGVRQASTEARSLVLAQINNAGPFVGELNIPTGSVTCRITWTKKTQNDLWLSFGGLARIPQFGTVTIPVQIQDIQNVTQAVAANAGIILNPDDTKDFNIKGKRAMSFSCENACIVNVTFYQQA